MPRCGRGGGGRARGGSAAAGWARGPGSAGGPTRAPPRAGLFDGFAAPDLGKVDLSKGFDGLFKGDAAEETRRLYQVRRPCGTFPPPHPHPARRGAGG